MAKAAPIDLDCAEPFAAAARRVVAVRAREVFEHSENVLDTTDIERVHDMRVATRRLRAALEVFADAFDRDALRPVLRDVKRLADALGLRRDPDVHLEEFGRLRESLAPAERAAADRLLAGLRDEQRRGNAHLAGALSEARLTDLRGRLEALAAS
jgi:CHAD domain-containing protein